jgi:serine phosphatase RsbU (regulator of sigma subunit)
MPTSRFLESPMIHRLLVAAGGVLFLLAVLQLPMSVFYQDTRPAMTFMVVGEKAEGLAIAPQDIPEGLEQSQVKPGDIMTRLNEIPFDSASRFESKLLNFMIDRRIGDTLRIDILRKNRPMTLLVPLRYTRGEVHGMYISLAIYLYNTVAPITSLLIALIILLRRPNNRQSTVYFLSSWCLSFYLLQISAISQFVPWWRAISPIQNYMGTVAAFLFQAILLHFLLIFPEERILATRRWLRNAIVYVPYLGVAALELLTPAIQPSRLMLDILRWADTAVFVGGPFIGIAILVASYRSAGAPVTRRVLKVIIVGLAVYGLSVFLNTGSQWLSLREILPSRVYLVVNLTLIIILTFSLPLSFGYAILRYGFLDVRIIFKRTTVYGLLAGVVVLFFIGFYTGLQFLFLSSRSLDVLFVASIVTGVVAIAIGLMKERVQQVVDRRIFREEFRVKSSLLDLSRRMLHILDRDEVLLALTRDLPAILELRSSSVVTFDTATGETACLAGDAMSPDQLAWLKAEPGLMQRLRGPDHVVANTMRGGNGLRQAGVVFPISTSNGELVAVVLGDKNSGKPLSSDELEMLDSVASHAALGWKNASVTEEMKAQERLKKEIEIAHSIQEAMLPTRLPEIPGFDIAAISLPAREVGGDFYDFLPVEEGRIAVIIGDVSDKGVSAAMVMASSISTLRFAAEQESTPRGALAVANRRLFLDTRRHMFVAAFFGILNLRTAELTFTNAGLPKPLLHRNDEGYLIDWSENGQHLPLGTKLDIDFHQQSLQLEPGDVLVLYTDGVVESRNAHDEEFGVKRLRDVVRRHAGETSTEIESAIITEVAAFSGRAELFDDLTVIVLKPV